MSAKRRCFKPIFSCQALCDQVESMDTPQISAYLESFEKSLVKQTFSFEQVGDQSSG